MRTIEVLENGGVIESYKNNKDTDNSREIFFQNIDDYLGCFFQYSKRPDNKYDIEYGFDTIIELNLMGIIPDNEYESLIDKLITVEDCISLIGKNLNINKTIGDKNFCLIKVNNKYYEVKTITNKLYLGVNDIEDKYINKLGLEKYYCCNTKKPYKINTN